MTTTAGLLRSRSRNPRGEGRRLRADVLSAATALLDAGGDERALTLRAVARRAGIATPSLYPHFEDRSALLLAVAREGFFQLSSWMGSARDSANDDPRQRFDAACRGYLTFARRHPQRYRTMFAGSWVPATDDASTGPTALGGQLLGILVDCLATCTAAGQRPSVDPVADALALWLGLHGLAHQLDAARAYPWPDDVVARVIHPLAHLDTA